MYVCRPVTSADGRQLCSATVPRTRTTIGQELRRPWTDDEELTSGATPLTGADAAYVQTQTEDPSVPALFAWRAHHPALL